MAYYSIFIRLIEILKLQAKKNQELTDRIDELENRLNYVENILDFKLFN